MMAPPMPTVPSCAAASPRPTTASEPVSAFGIRRVRRSMTAARPVADGENRDDRARQMAFAEAAMTSQNTVLIGSSRPATPPPSRR